MMSHRLLSALAAAFCLAHTAVSSAAEPASDEPLFRAIYKELVEIDTTASHGDTLVAAQAMANRLLAAGFPADDVQVLSSGPRKGDLVARLHGSGGKRPLLLLAHIDVVEAKREDWAFDPFKLQEVDGYFRGRGTIDDKAMAASFVANLIRCRSQGAQPQRDIILALTTDEELADSPHDGARWLLETHKPLIDAGLAINEGGGGELRAGKPVALRVQHAEKVYRSFRLEVKDRGGHSAAPRRDNPIYRLAAGLSRLADFEFPIRLNPITRAYLTANAAHEPPLVKAAIDGVLAHRLSVRARQIIADTPALNSMLRTTCVATLLEAGHAENALPQTARATINCRLLPDEDPAAVEGTLKRVLADDHIAVTPLGDVVASPASPLSPEVMAAVEAVAAEIWPELRANAAARVPVIPTQSGGYTDSRWLRRAGIATYGVSGLFSEEGKTGVHGLNEQVEVARLMQSREFLYRLMARLAR